MQIFISVRHDRSRTRRKKAATEAAAANFLQVKRDLSVFVEVRGGGAGSPPSLRSSLRAGGPACRTMTCRARRIMRNDCKQASNSFFPFSTIEWVSWRLRSPLFGNWAIWFGGRLCNAGRSLRKSSAFLEVRLVLYIPAA